MVALAGFAISPAFSPLLLHGYIITEILSLAFILILAAMANTEGRTSPQAWLALLALLVMPAIHIFRGELNSVWDACLWTLAVTSLWLLHVCSQQSIQRVFYTRGFHAAMLIFVNLAVIHALIQTLGMQPIHLPGPFQIFQPAGEGQPFGGMFNQRNLFALLMLMGLTSAWIRPHEHDQAHGWMAASILPVAAIISTSGRMAFILLAALALGAVYLERPHRRRRAIQLFSVVIAGIMIAAYWKSCIPAIAPTETVIGRLAHSTNIGGIGARLLIWASCLELWWQHPWSGIGPGQLIAHYIDGQAAALTAWPALRPFSAFTRGGVAWAHDWPLHLLTEEGGFGLIIMLAILAPFVRRAVLAWARRTSSLLYPSTLILLLLASGMVNVTLNHAYFMGWLALALSAMNGVQTHPSPPPRIQGGILFAGIMMLTLAIQSANIQRRLELAIIAPLNSDRFVKAMAHGLTHPVLVRQSIYWYFVRLWAQKVPARIWIGSYPLASEFWDLYQYDGSLKVLILISHLKGDWIGEKHWISLYIKSFPTLGEAGELAHHLHKGHLAGEVLEL